MLDNPPAPLWRRASSRIAGTAAARWGRRYALHIAATATFVVGWAVQAPEQLMGLIAYVPPHWRPLAAAFVGMAVFGLPRVLQVLKRLKAASGDNANG